MSIYSPGDSVVLYADIFPARLDPRPPGVPTGGDIRVVVTERGMFVLWLVPGGGVGREEYPLTAEDTSAVSFRGGQVGPYLLQQAGGCGCGSSKLRQVQIFDGMQITRQPRTESNAGVIYGVPPARYSRKARGVLL